METVSRLVVMHPVLMTMVRVIKVIPGVPTILISGPVVPVINMGQRVRMKEGAALWVS